jgi:hypothetical protein
VDQRLAVKTLAKMYRAQYLAVEDAFETWKISFHLISSRS